MERIPAACAMEWSIKLEKGLRSRKPGKSIEAILEIGPRIEWWNREPKLTMAEHKKIDLIPGEDKFFANSILLRLADAFHSGDKYTQLSIVKVFLSELNSRRKRKTSKKNNNYGIFSKNKLENYMELLKRVKMVFDAGNVEERAMALILFGCWANLAKDSAEIRYVIFSSLVSRHVMEVKASLFAAGCFCELSDDFSSVLLEMLVNLLTSSEASMAIRLAGGQTFAKIGWSSLLATRAYKTGMKLLSDSSEEAFSVVMLFSLSKIASKSTLLISEQIDLLSSFLKQEKTLGLRATSLRCLHFILARGVYFPASIELIKALLGLLSEHNFPVALQCEALIVLHKILIYSLPTISCTHMLGSSKVLEVLGSVLKSPVMLMRLLAIRVLVFLVSCWEKRKWI